MYDLLCSLCLKHKIKTPKFEFKPINDKIGGVFQWWNSLIIINSNLNHNSARQGLYHEFEHWYQYQVHPEKYLFWNPVPEETDLFYLECTHKYICPIEIDAYTFEYTSGKKNKRFLLEDISMSELELYRKNLDYQALGNRIQEVLRLHS